MKNVVIAIFIVLFGYSNANCQILTRYYQHNCISEKQALFTKGKITKMVPEIDNAKEIAYYDSINPARFGVGIDVKYTLDDGEWLETDSGKVWSMTFVSQNAKSLNFVIENLKLSEKSELYITNDNNTIVYGPINCNNAPENGTLYSDVIPGNTARIALYEPIEENDSSSLTIAKVVRGFRDIQSTDINNTTRSDIYNSHIACNPDWESYASGVALIMSSAADSYYTGFLTMSTDFSFIPYMLTVYELMDIDNDGNLSASEKENASLYTFKFLSKKETCNNEVLATSYTYSGATFRACYKEEGNHFLLLQLNNDNIKSNSKINWLGWDRSNETPTNYANIFHDDNNLLKLSTDYNSYVNLLNGHEGWRFYWDLNHYIGNKNGSPLFNQDKRIVGIRLWGGYSFVILDNSIIFKKCALYNKFKSFWTGGGTNSTRLSNWLDPIGTNQTTMDCGKYNDLKIGGQPVICESQVYRINNLPAGYTVNWTYTNYDSAPLNILTENTPFQNECTVSLSEGQKIRGTLTAIIKRNGQTVATRTLFIYNMYFWGGTFSQEAGSTTPQIVTQPFSGIPNSIPLIYQNAIATITSVALENVNVSYSGDTPSYWEYNSDSGYIKVKYPMSNYSQSTLIRLDNQTGCLSGFLEVRTIPQNNLSPDNISISYNNEYILIICCHDEKETYVSHYDIEITNAVTNQNVYRRTVDDPNISISTNGWNSSVYIVRISDGNQSVIKKIIVI